MTPRDFPVKICPACFMVWPSAQRICLECGHEFYPSKRVDKSSATFQCAPVTNEGKS
ncbi:putative ATP dependent helicase [Sinorhizobium phage HMSP1-Susan]|nr:putative ATP dependent helicase [Sinorhizobium phage HMSP1-Susan]